jgi:replicative DNA helicase
MRTRDILRDLEIPQDPAGEKNLLSALIHGPALCLEHAALLGDHLFNNPSNIIVFQAINELAKTRDKLEWQMLVAEVSKRTPLENIGGLEYLEHLWHILDTSSGWNYYYQDALNAYRRRQAVLAAKDILTAENPDEQITIAETALKSISAPQKSQSIPFKERLIQTLDWIEQTTLSHPPSLLKFGIKELDDRIYPVGPGDQVVIGGSTSSGKTALALQAVLQSPGPAAIFSLEMDARSMVIRILAAESGVPLHRIRAGLLSESDFNKLTAAFKVLESRPIWIEDTAPADIRSIAAKCRALKHQGLSIAAIDYLQLVTPSTTKRDASREREVAEISRSLKSLAMELGIVTVCLSQLNDDGKLRESRAIGQDADCVLCIDLDEDGNPRDIAIQKQRNGARGRIPVEFDGRYMRFSQARENGDRAEAA